MKRITGLFLLLFILAGTASHAQQTYTLEQCVETAVQNSLSIQRSSLQVEAAQSNFRQSKENLLPTINGSATETFRTGRSIDPFTNQFIQTTINSTSVGINAGMTLFNGFQQSNNIRKNRIDYQAAQYDVEQQKQQVAIDVANAYLQVVMAKEQLKVAQAQRASTEAQLKRVQAQYAAGAAAENQVLDLEAQLANDDINIIAAENQLRLAKLNLQQIMNIPLDTAFDVADVQIETITNPYSGQSVESLYQMAARHQYSLKSAELRAQSARISREIAQGRRLPTLSLNAGLSSFYTSSAPEQIFEPDGTTRTVEVPIGYLQSDPSQVVVAQQTVPNGKIVDNRFWNQMDYNLSSFVSINLNIPIYSAGTTRNSIQQSKIQERTAQIQMQETRNQLRQSIEQAYNNLLSAEITYNARLKQVEALERTFRNAEKRFELGGTSFVDYNLAKLNLARAQADLIRAKYEYLFRIKVLDYLTQGNNPNGQ
ncbi:MAG: transporter [Thermonema sp.]|uniref:TolC family protein n=1 Tax=Thermonema sp. TaxID=2231181 RepID=UPI0021DBDC38|nr:TolC family protein [Thermonema sp.]GIV40616.1 MAG: transporter [Thermonema sp.]